MKKPEVRWELLASSDFRSLFEYRTGERRVSYNLRALPNAEAEVWVNEKTKGEIKTIDKRTFDDPNKATDWLKSEEDRLKSNGWWAV